MCCLGKLDAPSPGGQNPVMTITTNNAGLALYWCLNPHFPILQGKMQTKPEGRVPAQTTSWFGRGAHHIEVREPPHTSNSSLSEAAQAPFLQWLYGDKCGALSAKNVRAGRSAPHRTPTSPFPPPPKPHASPPISSQRLLQQRA